MEIFQPESLDQESQREALRQLLLKVEEDVRQLHQKGGGNPGGLGVSEFFKSAPPEFERFVASVDETLELTPEEDTRVNDLIQKATMGALHDSELDELVEYFVRYQRARNEYLQ